MRRAISCTKCGKEIIKVYGLGDLCNACYTRGLNLSARGILEMKILRDELKQVKATLKKLRTTLGNQKLSLQTAFRKNEKLQLENEKLESDFEKQHRQDIKQRSGESVWAKDFVA